MAQSTVNIILQRKIKEYKDFIEVSYKRKKKMYKLYPGQITGEKRKVNTENMQRKKQRLSSEIPIIGFSMPKITPIKKEKPSLFSPPT